MRDLKLEELKAKEYKLEKKLKKVKAKIAARGASVKLKEKELKLEKKLKQVEAKIAAREGVEVYQGETDYGGFFDRNLDDEDPNYGDSLNDIDS